MAKLTSTDAALPARCAAPGSMRWAHSTRDGLAHAFPIEDSQQGRWVLGVAGSGRVTAPALVPPPPVHHHPRAAR